MLLQIITDTSTANWVIAVVLTILTALMYRLLNRIEQKLEEHEQRIQHNEKDIAVIQSKNE
jgi:uncharacterized protein YoxC